jgi:hypothetical protein
MNWLTEVMPGWTIGTSTNVPPPVIQGDNIQVQSPAQTLNLRLICGPCVQIRWSSTWGTLYRVQVSHDLRNWSPLHAQWRGTGSTVVMHDDVGDRTKFYRVERLSQEALR